MTGRELKERLVGIRRETEPYYRLSRLWRAWGYWESQGRSGPMRQACSFARMLAELPEVSNPGELIVGSTQGALARELPCDIAEEEYRKAEKTVEQELNLPFIAPLGPCLS